MGAGGKIILNCIL